MFSSAELIEALRRRMRRSLRPPPPPGEFPPGWRDWFDAMALRPGSVSGARPDDVIAVVAAREPLPPPGIVEQLGRWRAFASLWRQDWQPASRDERSTRVAAMSGSLLLHLLFGAALVWLMVFRPPFARFEEAAAREGETHVLQVEYIGEGTPADATGGGAADAPPTPRELQAAAASAAPRVPRPEPVPQPSPPEPRPEPETAQPPTSTTPPPLPERPVAIEVPELRAPALPAPQALQVTEVEVADSRHVVPPPREVEMRAPDTRPAKVAVRSRNVEVVAPVAIQAPAARAPAVPVAVPEASPRGVAVAEREVVLVETPQVQLRRVPTASGPATREARVDAPAVPSRDVPMPATPPAPAAGAEGAARAAADARDGTADAQAAAVSSGRPDTDRGARSPATSAGAGVRAGQPPGALPSRTTADDWGDSSRNAPGGQVGTPGAAGLFDGEGRPRLADGGRVGGGLPPGTITEDFENIDRHGTWLKRPPYDYEPTSFDRFWMPSETLLEEWVRKSVTEVRIPIPGTTKTIRCMTVMLALGGACDIVDPNLQEQPARARKPPDVPFKRELIEDQEALGPPPPQS
ncbi:hypothetical protein [Luteimonas sp. MC1895]|uniref:hypothetical protein n=1 Tax=Luteimonas sp. MC1895 TaxID=2819513 RepID=UPI0018F0E617|nr:hypothetical protein [Luteimonas sp. MC1895]MBJ6977926.1 hypothetical protein [Luteimonas sp. MC1895]